MSTKKSGVITVTTAGTAVTGPNVAGGFLLQAARGTREPIVTPETMVRAMWPAPMVTH